VTRSLPFYEFDQGVYEIDEFDCASVFVIVGKERALVLDTGTGIGDLRWVIERRITDKPYDVVLTHNHGDHIGGAGFFDSLWIHEADYDWTQLAVSPTLEFRKWYAALIREREDKHYAYDADRDIVPWPAQAQKKVLRDGQTFDLGGRSVTVIHCPGHTAGHCVALDSKTRTLFAADACNRNLLLSLRGGMDKGRCAGAAREALERLVAMRGSYKNLYNSHHDYRGFGSPLGEEVLPNLIECLKRLEEGVAETLEVPDPLSPEKKGKQVAIYKNVQISFM